MRAMTFRVEPSRGRRERRDRCGNAFEEGFIRPGLRIPIVLCRDCTSDLEESVKSYGETAEAAKRRFFDRLRRIGL